MLAELVQLGALEEGTEGTLNDPLVGNTKILARNPAFEVIMPKTERETRTADLDTWPSQGRAAGGRLSFEVDLYAQNQTDLPAWYTLIDACGLSAVTGGGGAAAHVINLRSSPADIPSLSLATNVSGYRRRLYGARGNVVFRMKAGSPIVAAFTFEGGYVAPTDSSFLSPTYDSNARDLPHFVSAAVALSAVSPATEALSAAEAILETFEIDMGNVLHLRSDGNAAMGFRSCRITGRKPMLRFDPEQMTVAQFAILEQLRLDHEFSITTGTLSGKAALNNIKFDAPRAKFEGVREGNRGGLLIAQAEMSLNRNAGNDSLVLTLSA